MGSYYSVGQLAAIADSSVVLGKWPYQALPTTTANAAAMSSARSNYSITAPVQRLEHFRRREIQLVEHEPVAAAHRLRERAVIKRDASNIDRREISAYISADGPTCASAPSWKATPPFSSGANDPTYSETSVCSWLLMRTSRWPVARASCGDDNSSTLEQPFHCDQCTPAS